MRFTVTDFLLSVGLGIGVGILLVAVINHNLGSARPREPDLCDLNVVIVHQPSDAGLLCFIDYGNYPIKVDCDIARLCKKDQSI